MPHAREPGPPRLRCRHRFRYAVFAPPAAGAGNRQPAPAPGAARTAHPARQRVLPAAPHPQRQADPDEVAPRRPGPPASCCDRRRPGQPAPAPGSARTGTTADPSRGREARDGLAMIVAPGPPGCHRAASQDAGGGSGVQYVAGAAACAGHPDPVTSVLPWRSRPILECGQEGAEHMGGGMFLTAVVLVAGIIILFKTVRMVPQGYEWTVERFGRYTHTMGPGLHFLIPVVYGVGRKVNMMEQVLDVPSQDVITKDNAVVKVDGVVFFQVLDAAKAAYEVSNLEVAMIALVQTKD